MHPTTHDAGAFVTCLMAFQNRSIGAGNSNAQFTGLTIDKLAYKTNFLSGKLAIGAYATMASGQRAGFSMFVEHSDDGSNWVDYDATPAHGPIRNLGSSVAASGVAFLSALDSGAANPGMAEWNVDLSGTKRYFRAKVTPRLTNSGTDVVALAGMWCLGGDYLPATTALR